MVGGKSWLPERPPEITEKRHKKHKRQQANEKTMRTIHNLDMRPRSDSDHKITKSICVLTKTIVLLKGTKRNLSGGKKINKR